jgi:nucleotide-binding universal stress UspA family protein
MKILKNILVAVDFNDAVGELMSYAESFAEKYGAKIWVVHVAAPDPDFVGYETGPQYIRDMRADELKDEHKELQQICEMFIKPKLASDALLIQGSTVETVLEEAKKLKADLLIVGTHQHSFFYNLFAESVSVELFKNAEIPVLSVPIEEG